MPSPTPMVKLADLKELQQERAALRQQLARLSKEAKAAARARAKLLTKVRKISTDDLRSLLQEREEGVPAATSVAPSSTTVPTVTQERASEGQGETCGGK